MRSNIMKIGLLLLVSLITINTVNAGFNIEVDPITNVVTPPGGTAVFNVNILLDKDALTGVTELAKLSVIVTDENGNIVTDKNGQNWQTSFSENLFIIGPYELYPKKTVTLEIHVPEGTQTGTYHTTVSGDGFLDYSGNPPQPDPRYGPSDSDESSGNVLVYIPVAPVPELNTMILTSAGLLGMILISRKNRGT